MSFLPSALEEAHRMSRESSPVYYRDGTPTRLTTFISCALYVYAYSYEILLPIQNVNINIIDISVNYVYYNVYYSAFRFTSIPPAAESRYRTPPALTPANESSYRTISYGGTSPWNSTGFAYTPRYPQSYRGIPFLLNIFITNQFI